MNQKLKTAAAAIGIMIGLAAASHAVQLQTMLQGYLTNASGTPFTGAQSAEFKLYQGGSPTTAGSGTLAYDEAATVTPSASGVFNYMLGSGTPVSPVLLVGGQAVPNVLSTATFDTPLPVYVEISVGGTVLLPRLQLLGMPFAAVSGVAESLKPVNQLTTNGLLASSGTFTAAGPATFSIQTSSGISVGGSGGVNAAFFNGSFYGSGAGLTDVAASNVAAGSVTPGTLAPGVLLAPQSLLPGPVTATSGTFTAAGPQQYSLQTSSGISVGGGGVTAAFFEGSFHGNGAGLSGVRASSVPAASVTPGILGPEVMLPAANLLPGPVTAASGTFTASGPAQYSIQTSSGISVGGGGGVTAAFFSGSFSGNGAGLAGIGGMAPIGSITAYAGQSEPLGWIECNGRSLSQTGNAAASWGQFNSAAVFAVLGTVWGSASAGQYNIPDLRGIFPRGWNHGKGGTYSDPDAASRVSQYSSGATGDAIGSYEADQVGGHNHSNSITQIMSTGGGGTFYFAYNSVTGNAQNQSPSSETRVRNASVMYIIRVQ